MCGLQNMILRVSPRDWEREQEGKRTEKDRNKTPKPSRFLCSWVGFEHLSLQASSYLVQQSWLFSSSQQGFPIPTAKEETNFSKGAKTPHVTVPDLSTSCAVKVNTSWNSGCEESTPSYSGANSVEIDTREPTGV